MEVRPGEPVEVLPDISEAEIQSFSVWLKDAESPQIYKRLQNDDLLSSEVILVSEKADPKGDDTIQLTEVADDTHRQVELAQDTFKEDEVEDEIELEVAQVNIQSQETEVPAGSLDESVEIYELINDIEASSETTEEEIIGELLMDILTASIYDTYHGDEIVGSHLIIEEGSPEVLDEQIESSQSPLEKFTVLLEKYEPEVRGQALELINSIYETVEELRLNDNLTEEDKELRIFELELAIHELFATLGIEIEDEQAHRYVELLLLTLDRKEPNTREYSIDYLNKMGTKEYTPINGTRPLDGLAQAASKELKRHELIGRYTIQVYLS